MWRFKRRSDGDSESRTDLRIPVETSRIRWIDQLRQDARYGVRTLRRSPGFALASILTLALGIGATTTMLSVGYGVLIQPLPYPQPDRLVRVWESHSGANTPNRSQWLSNLTYHAWNQSGRTIERIASFGDALVTLGGDEPQRVSGANVSPSLFDVLGVTPRYGRFFRESDAVDGAAGVVVLSDRLWRDRFGGDRGVIGRTIRIDRQPYTVIGVAPPGFAFPHSSTRLWTPSAVAGVAARTGEARIEGIQAIARLAEGITAEQAATEGTAVARGQPRPPAARVLWGDGGAVEVHARTLVDDMTARVRPAVIIFIVGVGCLLLIACANVANLLLFRGVAREREFTVRAAMGAGRGRLVRQLLTESLVMAGLGAAVGIVFAVIGIRIVLVLAPLNFPRLEAVRLDLTLIALTCAVSLALGTVVGLLPAFRAARLNLISSLREGTATSEGRRSVRLRSIVLAAEATVAAMLVVMALLLGRSFFRLLSVDAGYDRGNVLAAEVYLPEEPDVDIGRQQAGWDAFRSSLLARVRALPGVAAAGAGNMAPFGSVTVVRPLTIPISGRHAVTARSLSYVVTPGYAEALGLRLRAGRFLSEDDLQLRTQSLVVNEAFVRTFLGDVEPIGFARDGLLAPGVRAEVVGVVANVLKHSLTETPQPELYVLPAFPLRHDRRRPFAYEIRRGINLVVRTEGDPAPLVPAVREIVRDLRRDAVLDNVATLASRTSESLRTERFAAATLASFATVALILAAIGVYSMLSYTVSTRQREIGVRTALGASRSSVGWLVVRQGMSVTLVGLIVGIGGAFVATRFMRAMLFGIGPLDPVSFVLAPAVLAAVALVASVLPARRATRVDPLIALRSE